MVRPKGGATACAPAGQGLSLPFVAGLGVLGLGLAGALVSLPAATGVVLAVSGFAAVLWLLWPVFAVYALILLTPFTLTCDIGTVQGLTVQDAILVALGASTVASLLSGSPRIERFRQPLAKAL